MTNRYLSLTFSITAFISAFLIFWLEPLIAKMMLPYFGGAAHVWTTCVMLYQCWLLCGYLYAHGLRYYFKLPSQLAIHFSLLLLGSLCLPFSLSSAWQPNLNAPIVSIVVMMTIKLGLPFIVISATAPLLQVWFSKSNHHYASNPYFLYAASNVGSLLALMAFPFLFERYLGLSKQSQYWHWGVLLLILLLVLTARLLMRSIDVQCQPDSKSRISLQAWSKRLIWLLYSFVPSSLMLGLTAYISADVASMPLLWLLPLMLYLLSYILAFSKRSYLPIWFNLKAQLLSLILVVMVFVLTSNISVIQVIFFHGSLFFFSALLCHQHLYASRPAAEHLTEFYLWLAIGGFLGGVFNSLISPMVFTSIAEYPLILIVAIATREGICRSKLLNLSITDLILPASIAFILLLYRYYANESFEGISMISQYIFFNSVAALLLIKMRHKPLKLALGLSACLMPAMMLSTSTQNILYQARNFYGVIRVIAEPKFKVHTLRNGTTIHGSQIIDGPARHQPLSYYSNLSDIFSWARKDSLSIDVAIVGLGSGAIACYAKPDDRFTFYEINPLVIEIAQKPTYFSYLSACPAKGGIVLGDGRMAMQKVKQGRYDLIILDAYSSDAIPLHTITKEATQLYLNKLKNNGALVFHISNRHINLRPVLAALAHKFSLAGYRKVFTKGAKGSFIDSSEWVILTKNITSSFISKGWQPLEVSANLSKIWTDDYSNPFEALKY